MELDASTKLGQIQMRDQDDAWSRSRYFSEAAMSELYEEGQPTADQAEGFRLVAQRAIDASLELADELDAA